MPADEARKIILDLHLPATIEQELLSLLRGHAEVTDELGRAIAQLIDTTTQKLREQQARDIARMEDMYASLAQEDPDFAREYREYVEEVQKLEREGQDVIANAQATYNTTMSGIRDDAQKAREDILIQRNARSASALRKKIAGT